MSCCGNRDMAPAIAPLSEDFFNRSVELILPGHSSDIRLVYENDQWQNAGIEKSVEYKNLLERCKVLEREKKELKAKYDEALRKLAILSLEHEKLQNATEIHIKKNHRFNASVCKFYSKFKIMSCACRQQPVETYGYSTDIWSMTPQLKLSTASGPVEITYEDGVWSCTNSADPDIQKLHDSASQLERQKKHLEDKLRSIEEECRKKERAIEVILGSKKCTTVPRRKTPVFTAARNGNHVEKTLFSEVRSSATLL